MGTQKEAKEGKKKNWLVTFGRKYWQSHRCTLGSLCANSLHCTYIICTVFYTSVKMLKEKDRDWKK